jgi:hypothetical protein
MIIRGGMRVLKEHVLKDIYGPLMIDILHIRKNMGAQYRYSLP